MGTKSFFNKQKTQEVKLRGQEKSTIQEITSSIESTEYVKEYTRDKLDFVPQLDFQDPANFVKYGSAEDYYTDLVDSVVQSYPYDGSLAERLTSLITIIPDLLVLPTLLMKVMAARSHQLLQSEL